MFESFILYLSALYSVHNVRKIELYIYAIQISSKQYTYSFSFTCSLSVYIITLFTYLCVQVNICFEYYFIFGILMSVFSMVGQLHMHIHIYIYILFFRCVDDFKGQRRQWSCQRHQQFISHWVFWLVLMAHSGVDISIFTMTLIVSLVFFSLSHLWHAANIFFSFAVVFCIFK